MEKVELFSTGLLGVVLAFCGTGLRATLGALALSSSVVAAVDVVSTLAEDETGVTRSGSASVARESVPTARS